MEQLSAFLDSQSGLALKAAVIAAFADFATGAFAALRDGTFELDALAAFLRKHILGRVAPLGTLLLLGYFGGDSGQVFLPFAIAGLLAYAAETAASIKDNLIPPSAVHETAAESTALAANPVPTE